MILSALTAISITTLFSAAAGWIYARRKSRPLFPLWATWLFALLVLLGSFLIFVQFTRLEKANAQKSWPQTNGIIVRSEVAQNRGAWPVITYEYTINGKPFTGSSSLKFPGFGGRTSRLDAAKKTIAKYPPGQKVPVYYNPQNPALSMLRPGPTWDIFGQLGLGMTLLATGMFFLSQSFFARSRTNRNAE